MSRPRRKEAIAAATVVAAVFVGWLLLREGEPETERSSAVTGSASPRPGGSGDGTSALRPTPSDDAATPTPTPAPTRTGRDGSAGTAIGKGPDDRAKRDDTGGAGAPEGTIEGQVVRHADETPVEGASVALWSAGATTRPTARTDARGRFVFRELPLGAYTLTPSATDQEGARVRVRVPRAGSTTRVVLRIGGRAKLRFVPSPRKGDQVRLRLREGNGQHDATLNDGETLADLYVARWDVAYRTHDGRFAAASITLQPGENTLRLSLERPGRVEIEARDAARKRIEVEVKLLPLGQPTAVVGARRYGWIERTTYTIRRAREIPIPPGRYLVTARAVLDGYAAAQTTIDVREGAKTAVRLDLDRAATVDVAVEDRFLQGAIGLYGPRGWTFVRPKRPGDPLRVQGVPENGRGVLIAWDAQNDLAGRVEVAPNARPVLRLEPLGGVRVQVLRGGKPVGAGLQVRSLLAAPTIALDGVLATSQPPRDRPGALADRSITDPDGRCLVKLPPGRWTISAEQVEAQVTVPTRTTVEATLRLKD